MALPNGETITLRALGPLPDLDSVVFVRKLNRAFVTGDGPLLLALAAIYWVFLWFADRRAGREARLVKEGGLIGAELLSAKYYPGSPKGGSPSVGVKFRITLPTGKPLDGKQSFTMFDLDRRALPPAGSKLLVLRLDDTLQQLL